MRLEGTTVILEPIDCRACQEGQIPKFKEVTCPACGGSKKNPADRRKKCRKCTNSYNKSTGVVRVEDGFQECPTCNGNYHDFSTENLYTNSFKTLGDAPITNYEIIRRNRESSWNEQHLGSGMIFSVIDYGRHERLTDEELIREVQGHKHVQYIKVVNKERMEIAKTVLIVSTKGGYFAMAYDQQDKRIN